MAKFRPLYTKKYLKTKTEVTADTVYWKRLEEATFVKEFGAIDYIDFSAIEPYNFAVTCSVRVQIYDPVTKLVVKNLSRFQETAYGGTFRRDGRLLVAGDEQGLVKLFDTTSKNVLRLFKGHKAPVHRTQFTSDLLHIASFSDDKTVKVWDIASEKPLQTFAEHQDYVRAGVVNPLSANVIVSGGYDGKIKMYDTRSNCVTSSADHECPVEALLFLPSGGIFLSAGGTELRVWDAFAGCRLLARISQHHKTVTCLRLGSDGRRILSGSLDKHVKIYDVATYKTVHTLDYPSAVLSLGVAPNDQTVVAGMVDGLVSIRNMTAESAVEKKLAKPRRNFSAETSAPASGIDHHIGQEQRDTLAAYERHLCKFEYVKCLDAVLKRNIMLRRPEVIVTVMQELIHRKGLHRALAGRSHASLTFIITFLRKYMGITRFTRVLIGVAEALLDVYEDQMHELTGDMGKQFLLLARTLQNELAVTHDLLELQGIFELLLHASRSRVDDDDLFDYINNDNKIKMKQSSLAKDASILIV